MLGRKDAKEAAPSEKVETIIGKDAHIKGTLTANSGIRVEGRVEGDIRNEGDVIVGKGAEVKAFIKARHLTVAGKVEGDVEISGKLEIEATGRLKGDIKVGSLVVSSGAVFDGSSSMSKPLGKQDGVKGEVKPPHPA